MLRLVNRNIFAFHGPRCMILHPVGFPNKGPLIEQYLAEEAIGLAKSLNWEIVKGPFWNTTEPKTNNTPSLFSRLKDKNMLHIQKVTEETRDGDYIRTSVGSGYIEGDGMRFDQQQSESDGSLMKQWRNKLLRQSFANSSLIKTRRITKKWFFTKGKLHNIAEYLKLQNVDCLFINAELKPGQVKNLKKIIQAKINNLAAAARYESKEYQSETEFDTEPQVVQQRQREDFRKIKIFDRFSIILQIFAQRSTKKLSKLQIELSYLNYLKTRLVRDGSTYSSNLNMFSGDLMKTNQVNLEIISAKQRKAAHTMSGQGQSQLQIQRRSLRDKQAKIRREIQQQTRLRKITIDKNQRRSNSVPVVALVGYTNVGKSAFMNNLMKKTQVQSKDLLFQTLHTTSRHIVMPSGIRIMLLDTIGFITNLPVELVESFKTTLEEIAHADFVLHLRDVSHPQNQLQKQSVLKILRQLNFDPHFYNDKMMQVWNKIDLVNKEIRKELKDGIPQISCKTGDGMRDLMEIVDQKLKVVGNQKKYEVEYGVELHGEIVQWLKENTNTPYELDTEYDYESTEEYPNGKVKLKIDLDQATMGRLDRVLNPQRKKDKSRKGMPPKGW